MIPEKEWRNHGHGKVLAALGTGAVWVDAPTRVALTITAVIGAVPAIVSIAAFRRHLMHVSRR